MGQYIKIGNIFFICLTAFLLNVSCTNNIKQNSDLKNPRISNALKQQLTIIAESTQNIKGGNQKTFINIYNATEKFDLLLQALKSRRLTDYFDSKISVSIDNSNAILVQIKLMNGAKYPQPYPNVKIYLQSSEKEFLKIFTPSEYLDQKGDGYTIAEGQSVDIEVKFQNPFTANSLITHKISMIQKPLGQTIEPRDVQKFEMVQRQWNLVKEQSTVILKAEASIRSANESYKFAQEVVSSLLTVLRDNAQSMKARNKAEKYVEMASKQVILAETISENVNHMFRTDGLNVAAMNDFRHNRQQFEKINKVLLTSVLSPNDIRANILKSTKLINIIQRLVTIVDKKIPALKNSQTASEKIHKLKNDILSNIEYL